MATVSDQEREILLSPLHQDLTPPRGPNINGENNPVMRRGGKDRHVESVFLLSVTPRTRRLTDTVGRMRIRHQIYMVAVNGVVQKNITSERNVRGPPEQLATSPPFK